MLVEGRDARPAPDAARTLEARARADADAHGDVRAARLLEGLVHLAELGLVELAVRLQDLALAQDGREVGRLDGRDRL